jgi:hypothetical protein
MLSLFKKDSLEAETFLLSVLPALSSRSSSEEEKVTLVLLRQTFYIFIY